MLNITQFAHDKQVLVSEQRLRSLLQFIGAAGNKFNELQAVTGAVAKMSKCASDEQIMARMASGIANNYCDLCSEELNDFKQHHPDLANIFADDFAA